MKRFAVPLVILLFFEAVAVSLWLGTGNLFYLFNFSYIGLCISAGAVLFALKWKHARRFVQFAIGLYMLLFIGFYQRENMQIEGFWYYLFLGVFEGATIHYLVAKVAGPVFFGRGWCGYACWTAMVLDLLPWKRSPGRRQGIGWIRYVLLGLSLIIVGATLVLKVADDRFYFILFIIGNAIYYVAGIVLAAVLHDNRAFCKYLCPVGVVMKPAASLSLLRVSCDRSKCVDCGACKRVCPMDVDMTDNSPRRIGATECILCTECVDACPKGALDIGFSLRKGM